MVLITCLIDDPWLSAGVGTLKCLLPVLDYWSFWSYRWHTQNIKLKTVQWRHIWGQGWQTPLPRLAQSSALSNTGQVECRLERYPLYTLFLYYGTYDYYNSLIMYSLHQILNSLRAETMSSKFIFLPSAHRWSSIHVWIKDHMGGLFFFLKKQFLNCLDTSEKRKKRTDNEIITLFATYQPTGFVTSLEQIVPVPCLDFCIF